MLGVLHLFKQIGFAPVSTTACGSKVAGGVSTAVMPSSLSSELITGAYILAAFVALVLLGLVAFYGAKRGWKYFSKSPDVDHIEDDYANLDRDAEFPLSEES